MNLRHKKIWRPFIHTFKYKMYPMVNSVLKHIMNFVVLLTFYYNNLFL
jgi:hypothetical protein